MKKFAALSMSVLFALPALYIPMEREMTFADGFNGASLENSVFTSIPFSSKEDEEIVIEGGMPQYCNLSSRTNTCAPVAGAIVLGYYDKTYDELIENFTSARVIMGHVLYAAQTDAVDAAMARLYTSMKTNVTEGGTTVANFKEGLKAYVNEQGRNISYTQAISNEDIIESVCRQAIEEAHPIAMFVSKYTLISTAAFDAEEGSEDFYQQRYVGNHTVVCYGLRTIRYYDAGGNLTEQLDLLKVGTGYGHSPIGYILIDDYGTLVDGYEVDIY